MKLINCLLKWSAIVNLFLFPIACIVVWNAENLKISDARFIGLAASMLLLLAIFISLLLIKKEFLGEEMNAEIRLIKKYEEQIHRLNAEIRSLKTDRPQESNNVK